jgi:hypothetical protein
MIRLCCVATLLTLLSGCTFRAPQLEALYRFATTDRSVSEELAARAWTLEWLGEASTVYPVIVEDRVVFANAANVQVVFDGWQVLRVAGVLPYGRVARIDVSEERQLLEFLEDDVPLRSVTCAAWSEAPGADGGTVWTQDCEDLPVANRIVVDGTGATVELHFLVHPTYPPLQLRQGAGADG